jgi:hypothetical protein
MFHHSDLAVQQVAGLRYFLDYRDFVMIPYLILMNHMALDINYQYNLMPNI